MMKVVLTDITENAEQKIATAAAICYDSDTSPEANQRRITRLLNLKHLATLRFAYATFHVSGISRACSHQLVRHPHLSYLQRSQRYCKDDVAEFVQPASLDELPADVIIHWKGLQRTASQIYSAAIKSGMNKGDARYILPQAVETELYITGNFQAWMDFLCNRTEKAAQWEIREVATEIGRQLAEHAPNIFADYA